MDALKASKSFCSFRNSQWLTITPIQQPAVHNGHIHKVEKQPVIVLCEPDVDAIICTQCIKSINSTYELIVQADDAWAFHRHIPFQFSIPSFYDGNRLGTGKSASNNHLSVVKPFDYSYAHVIHDSLLLFQCPPCLLLLLQVCTETAPTQAILLHGPKCWYPLVGKSNKRIQRGKYSRWLTFSGITCASSSTMLPLAPMTGWASAGSIFPANMSNECIRPFVSQSTKTLYPHL